MKFITLIFVLIFCSCELHKQETITQEQRVRAEVNLGVLATLSKAISENDLNLIESTLNSGNFEINVVDEDGELLLIKAIQNNRFAIAKLLLTNGADPAAEDDSGQSALTTVSGHSDESEWLSLFNGDNLSETFATEKVFKIVNETNATNVERQLPLIKAFYKLGALVNGRNEAQYTPLMVAASNGVLQVVNFLCSFEDIDPNVVVVRGRGRRKQEFTALSLATQAGHNDVISALVACGAVK